MATSGRQPSPEDPYLWTVDELVFELCQNSQPIWSLQAKKAALPTADVFEKAIRDNILDGESFMSMETSDMGELGISAFGTKLNISKIIKFFRGISTEYRRQHLGGQAMPYTNGVESPQITSSNLSALPHSKTYGHQIPAQLHNLPTLPNDLMRTPGQWPAVNSQSGMQQGVASAFLELPDAMDFKNARTEIVQALEYAKEMRSPPIQAGRPVEKANKEPESQSSNARIKKKRRIAPIFISHNTEDRVAVFDASRSLQAAAKESRQLGHIDPYQPLLQEDFSEADYSSETTHEDAFGESPQSLEQKDVVGAMKNRLFRVHPDASMSIPDNPYLVPEQPAIGEIGASENLSRELLDLLARYPPVENDDGYALFGESGDEGEYDDETWNEIEAELEENKNSIPSSGALSLDQVNAAIDGAIAEMIIEWREHKFPKVQNKGYRMWKEATKDHSGPQRIMESNFWLNRFESTIRKLRAAISADTWHKTTEVKTQSRSLEESVAQKEEYKYYLSVLHSNEEPPRPDKAFWSRAKKTIRPEAPEGEEILESDSEHWSDGSFIEDHISDTRLIQYEALRSAKTQTTSQITDGSELPAFDHIDVDSDAMSVSGPEPSTTAAEPARPVEDNTSDDSDDQVISSARRRTLQVNASLTTPSRKQASSHRLVETSDDSQSELDSDLDASLPLPKSIYRNTGTQNKPIEFMSSSPSAPELDDRAASMGSIRTPELNPSPEFPKLKSKDVLRSSSRLSTPMSSSSSSLRLQLHSSADDGPSLDDVEGIGELEWDTIEADEDRRRALAKAVYELDVEFAKRLKTYIEKVFPNAERACDLLKAILLACNQENVSIETVADRDQPVARALGLLFLTYDTATWYMDEADLPDELINESFESVDTASKKFLDLLHFVLEAFCNSSKFQERRGKKRKSGDFDSLDDLLDDSDLLSTTEERTEQNTTRSAKKRKKQVLQSQEAESQQVDDRVRVAEQERLRAAMLEKMSRMADNADSDVDAAALHPVSFRYDVQTVYLDPHIGRKVKPHQENGIQFMWREISSGKGCVLAHTMGLGKTMQVISLLTTIAQASQSHDPEIQGQVPAALRDSRTLILCPPSLVDNWHDEILMWTPPRSFVLGEIQKVTAAVRKSERMRSINRWALTGGVLLMTYSLFKQIVEQKSKAIPEDKRASFASKLTNLPNIVVADEAHGMKNPKSGIAKAAKQFTTKARIALTGSPLSNHLEEYHQMVDWVSPGYLGSLVQFKAKYSEPIKEGLYMDSTLYEKRLSTRKLSVLKRDLEPKICRADISAISKDLPNKAEFFITVPLTNVQKEAYSKYADYMLRNHSTGSYKQARIWAWLAVLTLLLNHPSAFEQKLQESNKNEITPEVEREDSVDTDDFASPADIRVSDTELSSDAIKDILSVFSAMDQEVRERAEHSYRSLLTAQIVQEAMRIQEKVLIFSHSIPTLNYLERLLQSLDCTYQRIDGTTTMSSRQDMVKGFNKLRSVQVMLISTKAGGLGLNFQGANRVIIYDFSWNPTWEEQAVGRAYRLGQRKHVFVYRFRAGGTYEETIYNTSIFKTQLFARVVDKRNPMRFASKKLSDYLFPPREVEQAELTECRGRDPQVLDRIMERETCIRKVELTETFQIEEADELTPEEKEQAEQEYQDEVLARTDPVKARQVQYERQLRAAQQDQQTRMAQQQQRLFLGRVATPHQATPSRAVATSYESPLPKDLRPNDLRQPQFYPVRSPQQLHGAQDDTQLPKPRASPPRSAVAEQSNHFLAQVDGHDEGEDEKMDCSPQ